MGHLVECPECGNRFRIHSYGQRMAYCRECSTKFNAFENPAFDRDVDDPVGGN